MPEKEGIEDDPRPAAGSFRVKIIAVTGYEPLQELDCSESRARPARVKTFMSRSSSRPGRRGARADGT